MTGGQMAPTTLVGMKAPLVLTDVTSSFTAIR